MSETDDLFTESAAAHGSSLQCLVRSLRLNPRFRLGTPVWAGSGWKIVQTSSCHPVASRYFGCVRTSSPKTNAALVLEVGCIVINFGTMGRVLEIDPLRGVLLIGSGLVDASVGRWYADPSKCERVERRWA